MLLCRTLSVSLVSGLAGFVGDGARGAIQSYPPGIVIGNSPIVRSVIERR